MELVGGGAGTLFHWGEFGQNGTCRGDNVGLKRTAEAYTLKSSQARVWWNAESRVSGLQSSKHFFNQT